MDSFLFQIFDEILQILGLKMEYSKSLCVNSSSYYISGGLFIFLLFRLQGEYESLFRSLVIAAEKCLDITMSF